MKRVLTVVFCLAAPALALAKLPAPDDAAKAKAAEAAAKAAWQGKVDNYQLCKSQDKVAAHYLKTAKGAKGGAASACADPGPFVYTPAAPAAPSAAAPAAAAPAAPAAPAKKS